MRTPALSVIVPAYNEGTSIGANLRRLVEALEQPGGSPRPFEIIAVDDGSTDVTRTEIEKVAREDPRVRLVAVRKNRGKGRALARGCRVARGHTFVLLDADLQIPPSEIEPLLTRLVDEDADLVVGSKYLGGKPRRWPWPRRVLSRVYQTLTAILFRLPLRDTQTGLKVLRAEVAQRITPKLRARRFAWDLEFVLLAHRAGYRCVAAPVGLEPATRASRVRPLGACLALLDTCAIFVRDRGFAAYRVRRATERRPARLVLAGDDLGLSAGVTEGLLVAAESGGLTSVSVLARTPSEVSAVQALRERAPGVGVGLHLDLYTPRGLAAWLLHACLRPTRASADARIRVRDQLARLRATGAEPSHVDAHRHAWFLPWIRRAVLAEVRRQRVPAVRALHPAGALFQDGGVEGTKRLLLWAAGILTAGGRGLAMPRGHVGLGEVDRWIAERRVPSWARGRTHEVIAHPATTEHDLPTQEQSALRRTVDLAALRGGRLARDLEALGVELVTFRTLGAPMRSLR